jgi:hypothetical protein
MIIIIVAGYGNELIARTKITKKKLSTTNQQSHFTVRQKRKRQPNVRTYSRVGKRYAHTKFEPFHESENNSIFEIHNNNIKNTASRFSSKPSFEP